MAENNSTNNTSAANTSNTKITNVPIIVNTQVTHFSNPLKSTIFVKLNDNNFLLWKSMALAILRGQRLDGYILGTKVCPAEFLPTTSSDGSVTFQTNKEFEDWVTFD